MTRLYARAAAATVMTLLAVTVYFAFFRGNDDAFAQCRRTSVAGGTAQIGGALNLVDENGHEARETDIITGPTLVYFGYTFCPDVCPTDGARNAEAVDILEEMGHEVKPVFISVDPARDTPETLIEFTDGLHPRMVGYTGTPENISAAAKAYKAYFKTQDSADEYYLVDHTTFTYLMFPDTGFAEFFKRDDSPDDMANSVACFIEAHDK